MTVVGRHLRLKNVARIAYGLGQPPETTPEGVPILRATNIHRGRITSEGLIFTTLDRLPLDRAPLLQPGEILVVRSGAYTGDSALVSEEWAGAAPGYDLRVTPVTADPTYLAYFLLSRPALDQIDLVRARAAQPHLNAEDLGGLRLWVPPLDSQNRIAAYLDTETARIDALIAKKRRMIELLDERSQRVVAERFGKGLLYSLDGRPIGIRGIRCVRLGVVAKVQSGLTVDEGREGGPEAVRRPYLRVANVQDGSLDLTEIKEVTVSPTLAARCTLQPGDVLMTEGGDPDKLGRGAVWPGAVAPCLHQNHVFAVRPTPDLLPEYLALVTRTPYARAYFEMTASKTTGIASTSTTKIASFRVPLPSLEEQGQIVDWVTQRLAEIDAVRRRVEAQVDLIIEHRQAVITAAVSGDLEIPGVAA